MPGADGAPLRELIDEDQPKLGADVASRFGELPFLFKVLCADQPLSIGPPGKAAAEIGFAKENAAGIPLSAAEHKPQAQARTGVRPDAVRR